MADILTEEQRHKCMSKIRAKNTKPEVLVRKRLFSSGFRFRLNVDDLPGTPDIVLPKYRTAVFVNGCFWHGHKGCKYFVMPKTNTDFWRSKIERNQQRDENAIRELETLGWNVIIIWECELRGSSFEPTIESLIARLEINRELWDKYLADRARNRKMYREERTRLKEQRDLLCKEIPVPSSIRRLSETSAED